MALIWKQRVLTCILAITLATVLGCRDSSPTSPPAGDSASDTNTPQPVQENTVDVEPSIGESRDSGPLEIGSVAPPLSIAQWINGEAIDGFNMGQVYVVEFWATWCGPCRTSMPHLSQLQDQYGEEVNFVGVTREPE